MTPLNIFFDPKTKEKLNIKSTYLIYRLRFLAKAGEASITPFNELSKWNALILNDFVEEKDKQDWIKGDNARRLMYEGWEEFTSIIASFKEFKLKDIYDKNDLFS